LTWGARGAVDHRHLRRQHIHQSDPFNQSRDTGQLRQRHRPRCVVEAKWFSDSESYSVGFAVFRIRNWSVRVTSGVITTMYDCCLL
jgi:hypothetical protein